MTYVHGLFLELFWSAGTGLSRHTLSADTSQPLLHPAKPSELKLEKQTKKTAPTLSSQRGVRKHIAYFCFEIIPAKNDLCLRKAQAVRAFSLGSRCLCRDTLGTLCHLQTLMSCQAMQSCLLNYVSLAYPK